MNPSSFLVVGCESLLLLDRGWVRPVPRLATVVAELDYVWRRDVVQMLINGPVVLGHAAAAVPDRIRLRQQVRPEQVRPVRLQTPAPSRRRDSHPHHHQEGGMQTPPPRRVDIPPPNVVKFGDYSSKPGNWPHPTTIKKQEGFTPRPSRRRRYSHPTIAKKEEGFTPHHQEGRGIHTPATINKEEGFTPHLLQ